MEVWLWLNIVLGEAEAEEDVKTDGTEVSVATVDEGAKSEAVEHDGGIFTVRICCLFFSG